MTRRPARRGDIWAGIVLASMNIPQVLGYTRIAGTPVVTGLYTVLLPLLAFTVLGSSRHLVVAADSATAAIFYDALSRMAAPGGAHYMALVGMLALLTSGLLLLARIFRLGFLADFLSRTVLVGLSRRRRHAGRHRHARRHGSASLATSHNTLRQALGDAPGLAAADTATLGLAGLVAGGILLGARSRPAVAGLVGRGGRRDRGQRRVRFRRPRHRGHRPGPRRPALAVAAAGDLGRASALLPVAASCFVMILAQSAATSRVFARALR